MSGDSKIYTLAIGERGSDVSVDLFGVDIAESEAPDTALYSWSEPFRHAGVYDNSVKHHSRHRVAPYYLPYGKTHVLVMTVDKYNRISDISHSNTLFGGGDDLRKTHSYGSTQVWSVDT